MNIIIEDAETLQYLAGNGRWSKNAGDGKTFRTTEVAFQTAKNEPIGGFNIVSYIAQTRQLVNMDHGRGKGLAAAPA